MKIRLIRLPFLIPTWAQGQVIFPRTIFHVGTVTPNLLAHELAHVMQIKDTGLFPYWVVYLLGLFFHGYEEHPYEDEAWLMEDDSTFKAVASYIHHAYIKKPRWFRTITIPDDLTKALEEVYG